MDGFANDLIDAMGGTTAVAGYSHAGVSTVHNWRKNGLPASRLDHLRRIAIEHFPSLDLAKLADTHGVQLPAFGGPEPRTMAEGRRASPGKVTHVSGCLA